MNQSNISETQITQIDNVKVTRERRTALFGLIEWWEELKSDRLSNDIHIKTEQFPDKIIIYCNDNKKIIKIKL